MDKALNCPACAMPMRAFANRLCCDACNGIMITFEDLKTAISELVALTPQLFITGHNAGPRTCPHCRQWMVPSQLRILLETFGPESFNYIDLADEVDRCEAHGIWFDDSELANLFAAVYHRVSPKHVGNNPHPRIRFLGRTY